MGRYACFWLSIAIILTFTTVPVLGEEAGDKVAAMLLRTVAPAEELLPAGTSVVKTDKPGDGPPIGAVDMVQGDAALIYRDTPNRAYQAKKGLSLYAGDTLITGERGRIQASLNDKSSLVVSPYSKLELNESIYNPNQDSRRSRLSLLFGKAKFLVSRLAGGRDRDYVVNTPTAILSVRGTEFAVAVMPASEFTALASKRTPFISWMMETMWVKEAFAQSNGLITTAITGPAGAVYFGGASGNEVILQENSVSYAAAGLQAAAPMAVTAGLISSILNRLGPSVAVMGMPAEMD